MPNIGSAYNEHFECTCYHPLFRFNKFGDIERVILRNGNVYSSDNRQIVLEPAHKKRENTGFSQVDTRIFGAFCSESVKRDFRLLPFKENFDTIVELKGLKVFPKVLNGKCQLKVEQL
jgi:hypothetical protein